MTTDRLRVALGGGNSKTLVLQDGPDVAVAYIKFMIQCGEQKLLYT